MRGTSPPTHLHCVFGKNLKKTKFSNRSTADSNVSVDMRETIFNCFEREWFLGKNMVDFIAWLYLSVSREQSS